MQRPIVMRSLAALACIAGGLVGVQTAPAAGQRAAEAARVAWVVDGDTIALADGRRVRLVQIDTPELGGGECYSRAAARALRSLLPAGARVTLEADPRLDRVDRYGRLLRYVWAGGRDVNLELVRRGAATVWLYGGARGRYADRLLAAARAARARKAGLWGACPDAVWNPTAAADTGTSGPATSKPLPLAPGGSRCDPAYPDVCIPPSPPDLDCDDIPYRHFRVLPPDPHRFDGRDRDGIGCES